MRRAALLPVCLLLLLGPAGRSPADEDAARYFTERGNRALGDKEYREAERQFTKAIGEQPGFLPARLGLARAAVGLEDRPKAVGILEGILDALEAGGPSSEEEKAVGDAAEKLLKDLDRPRLEYRKLTHAYVRKLAALLERCAKENPDLARRCFVRIVRVAPRHPLVSKLRKEHRILLAEKPGGKRGAAKPGEEPLFNGVDLEGWSGKPPIWSVVDGRLTAAVGDSSRVNRYSRFLEGDYTLVFEARLARETGEIPLFGLCFGFRGLYRRYNLFVLRDKFRFSRHEGSAEQETKLASVAYYQVKGGVDRTAWNRYEIRVRGKKVTCFVNGEEICSHESEDADYDGAPAMLVQDCTAEFRRIVLVK